MRRLLLLTITMLILVPLTRGQNLTTVTATVVDPNGTVYINGTYSIVFYNPTTRQATYGGIPLQPSQMAYSGQLSTSGGLSVKLPSNAFIDPSGTQWTFKICANPAQITMFYPPPTLPCFSSTQTISGASQVVTFTAAVIPTYNQAGALTSPVITPNPLSFDVDLHFKGPNPYVDVTRYGVRAINPALTPAAVGLTADITSGSPTATISSASSFINGDGVVIYGAGAAHAMSTPGAPTVTPSVARVATGIGDVVNGPAGATTYNYQVIARDKNGGMTAASTVGTTAAGAASLGSQTVGVTSWTRSNNTVTVVTSATHGLAVGAVVLTTGMTDTTFSGWYQVATVPDTTHFTFTTGMDTRNGATTSATGGAIYWFNCNHLSWTTVTGAFVYYIYGRTGGSLTLLGVTRPSNPSTVLDTTWDDYGSPMMDGILLPAYVPNTPPIAATSDHLSTTIISGAGTTTLVLAANAGTTIAGATIRFDNTPGFLAAAAAFPNATLYVPLTQVFLGTYLINSYLNLTANTPAIVLAGGLQLNETLETSSKLYGDRPPVKGSGPSFGFTAEPVIAVSAANPGIYWSNSSGGPNVTGLNITGFNNGSLLLIADGGFFHNFDNVNFTTGGTGDYMGIGLLLRGNFGNGPTAINLKKVLFSGGPTQVIGSTATPLFYCQGCGVPTKIDGLSLSRRGIIYRPDVSGGDFELDWGYAQGGITPLLTIAAPLNGNGGAFIDVGHVVQDTMPAPLTSFLPGVNQLFVMLNMNYTNGPSAGFPQITGNKFNLVRGFSTGGQNTAVVDYRSTNFSDNFVGVNSSGAMGFALPPPLVPVSAVVSAGGAVPIGTHTYSFTWVDTFGLETPAGPTLSATTTGGNQTVTVTPPTAPTGAITYFIYRDNLRHGTGSTVCGPYPVANTFVDTLGFPACGQNPGTGALSSGFASAGAEVQALFIAPTVFANLGTPIDGKFLYCPDCTIANPCAGGGTGALAKRLNGVWVCN